MEEKEILLNGETLKGKSPTEGFVVKMTYDYWIAILNTMTNLSTRLANIEARLKAEDDARKAAENANKDKTKN